MRCSIRETLSIEDNRTGIEYELEIKQGAIRAMDLKRIRVSSDDVGLSSYDARLENTAICESGIALINASSGSLRYRGYPIDQLAERCSYLEVAYLLINGQLPDPRQNHEWTTRLLQHTSLAVSTANVIASIDEYSNPTAILVSAVASLSALHSDKAAYLDFPSRAVHIDRLIGQIPMIALSIMRRCHGLPPRTPDTGLNYCGRILDMIRDEETPPNPAFERVLDMMFILHAEHEQNCSTAVMRCVGSALADPYLCTAAAASALSGPLHGGANLEVLRMLGGVGAKERVHDYLVRVKAGQAPLSGFGHQVYEIYDPRARIVRRLAEQISESTKRDTLLDVALEFERIAMEDEFFLSKNLYPTIELYSGILFRSLGFPIKALPLLFAIARTSGWLAHWSEMLDSPKRGMVRPRQIYNGPPDRELLSKIE